jgi:hypothetical protein
MDYILDDGSVTDFAVNVMGSWSRPHPPGYYYR